MPNDDKSLQANEAKLTTCLMGKLLKFQLFTFLINNSLETGITPRFKI